MLRSRPTIHSTRGKWSKLLKYPLRGRRAIIQANWEKEGVIANFS